MKVNGTAVILYTKIAWTIYTLIIISIVVVLVLFVAQDNKGEAYAIAVGSTDITAEYQAVKSPAATLSVSAATLVSTVIEPVNATVALKAGVFQFKATGTFTSGPDRDITKEVAWISRNSNVVFIRDEQRKQTGLVILKGIAASPPAIIEAVSRSGGDSDVTNLTVDDPAITGVSILSPDGLSIKKGEILQLLTAEGTFSSGGPHDVTLAADWKTSLDVDNVLVDKGVIYGILEGTSTVVVNFGGFTDQVVITVTAP